MLTQDNIKSVLLFDLETCGQSKELFGLPPLLQDIFIRRTWQKIKEEYKDENEGYLKNAGLYAEYGKIICASFAMIKFDENISSISLINIADENEKILLEKVSKLLNDFSSIFKNGKLCGYNIKNFDIPFLSKRFLINRLDLPNLLDNYNKKPWEISCYDLFEMWSFGQKKLIPFELVLASLNIDTPKDDIHGHEVHETYYSSDNKINSLNKISKYCGKDVIASCQLLLRLNNIDVVNKDNIISKTI